MQPLHTALPIAILATIVVIPNSTAQDNYVEGTAGVSSFDSYPVGDKDYNMIGARFGRNFTPNLALEGEFAVGTSDSNTSFGGSNPETNEPVSVDASQKLCSTYGVFGKATLPLGDHLTAHVRLGYATSEHETEGTITYEDGSTEKYSSKDIDPGVAFGVGTAFSFTDQLYARADATRYEAFYDHIDSFTLGVGFRF